MIEQLAVKVCKEALLMVLILSGPVVLVSMIVGLVISIFQATTQIQEQTLSFVPKLLAVFVTLILFGPWLMAQMIKFVNVLFTTFPDYIK